MPTLPHQPEPAARQPHRARTIAESFGVDAHGYDRARPRYPDALIARIVAESPGPEVLDVGCGTGIAGRQLQAAGCRVLGIEPDARMAEFAGARGLPVEVATFETWAPRGRSFDAVVAAQSWHWVDPAAGSAQAARVLRPRGRIAIFGHVFEPPAEVAEPFADAYRRAAPDSPFADQPARRPLELYETTYTKIGQSLTATGTFSSPELWRYDWDRTYTREEWLALLPTTGGLTSLTRSQQAEITEAVGSAIDALGGRFTMHYTTLAISAIRDSRA
ncbi:class I SAM-dependent methyltransferase [Nocardia cyriacigeorgica]|uniref:class I SAM-dependent methyltransferase n=1 Tax=Nocardia cyriacigeorgica TaxID=135487 RepID=UPI0003016172|nr:class I SAM-dependent methyltransferase [Nocardia cyriacigeorgica]MBF6322760.1 class I SAM-dependent methyltransferase [Nocardia cyriacigeorgica]TLF55903.1 class I SAM-dependent methyltransferase [Nocardia cyriacigeorgica]